MVITILFHRKLPLEIISVPQNQPDYIIGLNGILTLGAIAICHELKIYNNIKFFSIDEPPKAADYGLHIAGVYHDTQMLGRLLQNSF